MDASNPALAALAQVCGATADAGRSREDRIADPWDHPLDPWHHLEFPSLQGITLPKRRWIVQGWVPQLETTGLSGQGGDGKTLLAQMLATAGAIGAPWLGIEVPRIKTFLVLCEDREADIQLRQENINRLFDCDFSDLENMRPVPRRVDPRNRLMIFDRNGIGHLTTFFFQLLEKVKEFGAQLVILDTKSDLFLGNQNDEDQARTFVRQVTDRIAEETDGATLLIYHPSRAGMKEGTGESGSVQWDAAFRSRLRLERVKPADKEERADPFARVLTRKKSNFALRDEKIEMKWEDGVFVRTSTPASAGIFTSIKRRHCEHVFLDLLDAVTAEGRHISESTHAPNYAPKLFASRPDRDGYTRADFKRAMETLFARREIEVQTYGRKSDERRHIVRAPVVREAAE